MTEKEKQQKHKQVESEKFAKRFTTNLKDEISNMETKQTSKVTGTIIKTAIATTQQIDAERQYPSNTSRETHVHADKRKDFIEEETSNTTTAPPRGNPLDLQVTCGNDSDPYLNLESELHGNKQANTDFNKLLKEPSDSTVSAMVIRIKSEKHTDRTINSMAKKTKNQENPVCLTVLKWNNNTTVDKAGVRTVILQQGNTTYDTAE
ncbi:hypothetical protein [Thalassospira sp.]|uniref:hypothetical protein n=1 Tax=Thalassospira sp. TaxID=1912094 RepID=UPI001B246CC5|nr:hypothetical protein [Thalassospira sp.]MBO6806626.1 hypothetical protein [Thalassospira sp.]MBO6838853.1 hypothetical protein [Thalassospira sp.]